MPAPEPAADEPSLQPIVSDTTASVSGAAFASLAERLRDRMTAELPLGNGAVTLEQITRELLKPLLRSWLDAHLPALVERLVQEEVERLARGLK
jgi:cell pole-organizing protein PopZ